MNKKLLHFSLYSFFAITSISCFSQDWNQLIKGVASDREQYDKFGTSVDIHGDFAVVGAPNAEAAYVFKNISGNWIQTQVLTTSITQTHFGNEVAIYGDYIVVGSKDFDIDESIGVWIPSDSSYAYVFKNISGTWEEIKRLKGSDIQIGDNFSFSLDIFGDYIIAGAKQDADINGQNIMEGSGSVYVFKNNLDTWTEVQKITASDRSLKSQFGYSVSIYGDYIAIGTDDLYYPIDDQNMFSLGAAYIFKNISGTWVEQQKVHGSDVIEGDNFGRCVGINNDFLIVGSLKESEDENGLNTMINSGSAYIFKNNNDVWTETQKIVAFDRDTNFQFGSDVTISNEYLVVSSSITPDLFTQITGSAYVFKLSDDVWSLNQKIISSDISWQEEFSKSVAIYNDQIIIGACRNSTYSSDVDSVIAAGAVYFFESLSAGISNLSIENSTVFGYKNTVSIKIEKIISAKINIIDVLGNSVCKQDIIDSETAINLNLPTGVYLVELTNNGIVETKKVFVGE